MEVNNVNNVNNAEDTIDLKQLIGLMLSKLWLIILLALIGGTAGYCFSHFMMPLKYESYLSMYVKNATNSSSTVNENINLGDLNASKSLVATYMAVLKDDAVMEEVGRILCQQYDTSQLMGSFNFKDIDGAYRPTAASIRSCISMVAVDSTEVLKITAVTCDPEISAAVCNVLASVAPDFLGRVVGAGSVESIGKARVHLNAVSPNVKKYAALGGAAGAVFAMLIIFLVDFFDTTVKDREKLMSQTNKAIIGEIQEFSSEKNEEQRKKRQKDEKKANEFARATLLDPDIPFYIIEGYKGMRTNIIFSLATQEKRMIAVSSANPGEGKSTTAANLAIALAQTDCKVLLIDADMRKPVQHRTFGVKNKNGLSDLISKLSTEEQCIHRNVSTNLDLITSGPKPPNPSELLASQNAEDLFARLSEMYDYIILDTPPVNVVSDAMGVTDSIAGMIMVARYASTTYEDVDEAMKKIALANGKLLGFILNGIHRKSGSAYNYKYKYKSKYYSDYGYGYGYGHSHDDQSSDNEAKQSV